METVNIQFPQMPFMHGSVPKRRRSSSTCGAMLTLPAPTRLWLMRSIALPIMSNSGKLIYRADAKSSRTAFMDNSEPRGSGRITYHGGGGGL